MHSGEEAAVCNMGGKSAIVQELSQELINLNKEALVTAAAMLSAWRKSSSLRQQYAYW